MRAVHILTVIVVNVVAWGAIWPVRDDSCAFKTFNHCSHYAPFIYEVYQWVK